MARTVKPKGTGCAADPGFEAELRAVAFRNNLERTGGVPPERAAARATICRRGESQGIDRDAAGPREP